MTSVLILGIAAVCAVGGVVAYKKLNKNEEQEPTDSEQGTVVSSQEAETDSIGISDKPGTPGDIAD